MINWNLEWAFDKDSYSPGDQYCSVNLWIENTGENHIFASEAVLRFDEIDDTCFFAPDKWRGVQIEPHKQEYLTKIDFFIPETMVGLHAYAFGIEAWEFDPQLEEWEKYDVLWGEPKYQIGIWAAPYYRVFVSRSNDPKDKPIVDPIEGMIMSWGFDPYTVNIPRTNPTDLDYIVSDEVLKSDCIIGIATKRDLVYDPETFTYQWKTLEWLHKEAGMGLREKKPTLLIIDHEMVDANNVPNSTALRGYESIPFNPSNLQELKQQLDNYMPSFREWINTKEKDAFQNEMRKTFSDLAAVIFIGSVGYCIGRSMK
jgi:hypothetical protein